jgi:hypothetical protein
MIIDKHANIIKDPKIKRLVEYKEGDKQVNVLDSRFYRRDSKYYPSVTSVLNYFPKKQFFNTWLKDGEPDGYEFNYTSYPNIPYPKYWLNNVKYIGLFADQAGDYAKGHEHFKKINKLTKQQFQRAHPQKVDEISNFMTQPTKPVSAEEQWKRQIRLLAKQYQTNAGSLAALGRENGADSAEAVAYEYLRDPSKIRVPGTAAPASAVNWDEVIRRLPMGLSGMALLQAAEEYLINNRGMLRSTVRSLLNNDENQRTLSAAYAKKKTPLNQ